MTEKIVRTATKASGGVTPEEMIKLKEHAEMWKKRILRTKSVAEDFPKLRDAIFGIYEAADKPRPIVILAPSPIAMAYAYGAAAAIWHARSKGEKIDINLGNDHVSDIIRLAIQETKNPISAAVRMAKPSDTVLADARATCFNAAGQFGIDCAKRWNNVVQCGAYSGFDDAYFTAFRDVIGLKLPIFEKYKHWEQASIYGTLRVMHPNFCIVSDFPTVLKMDDQNRAHGQDGPSHRWADGFELYHWHGVRIPNEWIKTPGHLTAKMAITWQNIEQRRAACEILGWVKVLDELGAKVVDEDADPEIGTLLEVVLPDAGKEKFLRVQCGTGRTFALPVPPEMKTAMEANAWTYGLNLDEFKVPEVRT
jgi:hypothetical protein